MSERQGTNLDGRCTCKREKVLYCRKGLEFTLQDKEDLCAKVNWIAYDANLEYHFDAALIRFIVKEDQFFYAKLNKLEESGDRSKVLFASIIVNQPSHPRKISWLTVRESVRNIINIDFSGKESVLIVHIVSVPTTPSGPKTKNLLMFETY